MNRYISTALILTAVLLVSMFCGFAGGLMVKSIAFNPNFLGRVYVGMLWAILTLGWTGTIGELSLATLTIWRNKWK